MSSEPRVRLTWMLFAAVAAWAAALATWVWPTSQPQLEALFLDVGEGDATLIRTPRGAVVLVDAGPIAGHGAPVLRALKSWGVRRVDLFVLTHPDADHIGGAADVMRAVPVQLMLDSGFRSGTPTSAAALSEARDEHVRTVTARLSQRIDVGDGVTLEVLNPGAAPAVTSNDASIVLRVTFGDRALLLTGDAGHAVEDSLLAEGVNLRADVLKVSHHGSGSATSDRWLSAVRPTYAVISCGAGNRNGHPDPAVSERLRRFSRVFRTDTDGAVHITTDGRSLAAELSPPR